MPTVAERTSGRAILRNTALNLFGLGAPALVAVVCVPLIIRGLGADRFGILTLVWATIGYFSLFDLGLGNALVKVAAQMVGEGRDDEIPALTWTASAVMLALGLVGALALALSAPWLAGDLLRIPAELERVALTCFYLVALAIPCVISTAGLRGLLEATHRFDLVNAVRLPLGMSNFLGPLLVVLFTRDLRVVVAVLVATRYAAWVAHVIFCARAVPGLWSGRAFQRGWVGELARYGGWMTVTNLSSTLMVYLDRFVIGASVSMAALAYYSTPYEAVTKLWMIPGALMGVVFPAFIAHGSSDPPRAVAILDRAARTVFVAIFPVVLVGVALAYEGLRLWVGTEFAMHGAPVLRWLAVGVFANCMGMVAATALQAYGRPDVTAKANAAELPLYLAALWGLLQLRGIEGAAIAWALRAAVDMVILFAMVWRTVPATHGFVRATAARVGSAFALFGLAMLPETLAMKLAFAAVALAGFGVVAWTVILSPRERDVIRARLSPRRQAPSAL